jgi:hypothetical protein
MLSEPYVIINQNKVHMKGCPSRKKKILHVKGEKISIQQKIIKIGTFENKVQIWSFKSP